MTASKSGFGCLLAFLTPFFLVGVGGLVVAVQGLLAGDLAQAGGAALFGLMFGGTALGFLLAARAGRARSQKREANTARFPDEPWKWRAEWEVGRIESSNRATTIAAGAFALFWNLMAWPIAVAAVLDLGADPKILLVLLFPAIGLGLATWAGRQLIRLRKFGVSVFEMAHVPGVIGRGLGGLIRTTVPLRPDRGFRVRLSCIHRKTTGSGDDQSTTETVLWQESETVTDVIADPDGPGVMVPVAFPIPLDARVSDDSNSRDAIVWRLEVETEVPGVDYHAAFEVPVFRTEESERAAAALARGEADGGTPEPAEPFAQPPESKIRVRHYGRGVEIDFPAARNPGAAFLLTGFFVVWSVFLWVMIALGAPLVFPILFGSIDVLLLLGVLSLWFGVGSVRVRGDTMALARGLVFPWRVTTVTASEFERAFVKNGMQSGSRIYYDLFVAAGGKNRKVASSLRRKREAEWLATVITDAIEGTE